VVIQQASAPQPIQAQVATALTQATGGSKAAPGKSQLVASNDDPLSVV